MLSAIPAILSAKEFVSETFYDSISMASLLLLALL
jgi:hypothetical protein